MLFKTIVGSTLSGVISILNPIESAILVTIHS